LDNSLVNHAKAMLPQLSEWRRHFHQYPELGFQERGTAAHIAEVLTSFGYRVRTGVGRTGVIAEYGQGPPLVGIRADMDALPIPETDDRSYTSRHPGLMHACGHDAHIAMALGSAALLRHEPFPGTIRFLFQPSEEVADAEGISGAPAMIQDGALEGMGIILALHVDPATPVEHIRIAVGPSSGGVDSFRGAVIGTGGHGARPHAVIDPFYITAHVILALNGIISRRIDPFEPAVVSIGTIHGGQADNVIPERVKLSGTIRFMQPDIQQQIHIEVRRAFEIARTLGGDYELSFEIGTPPMINDARVVHLIQQVAADLFGTENVLPPLNGLGAEDFGCFSERVPGAMFSLGCRIEGDERQLHNPRFDLDEHCLPVGSAILVEAALRYLRSGMLP
jgi:amidohydrolase